MRIADDLLRTTFTEGGFPQALSRTASLVVVYGIRPDDAAILHLAAQDLIGGAEDDAWSVEAKVRDWTDLESQRPDYVQRLLNEASVATRTMIVFCRKRSEVPAVVATVADAVLPLADRKGAVEPFVEEIGKFLPDRALLDRLSALPLSYLNLVLRPGTSRERMWAIAGRLRRTVGPNGDTKPGSNGDRRGKKVASTQPARSTNEGHPERLEDMPGMGEAQRWGLSLAADLARYRNGSLPWCDIENGAVLHGPPGTGKTLFASALAGSCGVPLLSHSFASWQAKGHLGDLLKALRGAFDEARKSAPCVLFIDELDSVGSRDEPLGDHASYQRQVVNGLLESLDGTVGRGGVVVIGATNALSAIDPAILRPGRLGRIVEVSFPDVEGRIGIFRHHLRGDLAEVSLDGLAADVGEASGAAIAEVVREARAMARRDGRALREADLYDALPKSVLLSESAFRRFCLHEAGHVIVGLELAPLSGIVPTGAKVRRRVRHGGENRTNFDVAEGGDRSRESVEANVVVFLAGLAAEEVVLGSRGAGAGGTADADLVRATQLVAQAEFSWGLGDGLHSVTAADAAKAVSRLAAPPDVRDRIDRVLARCLQEARDIIERRRDDVERVAARLAETSELTLPNPELGLA